MARLIAAEEAKIAEAEARQERIFQRHPELRSEVRGAADTATEDQTDA